MVKQPTQTRIRRKEKKNVTNAVAHVNSSFNNTVVTITDIQGNAIIRNPIHAQNLLNIESCSSLGSS